MQYSETAVLRHRVHLRGRATLHWPSRTLCIEDGKNGLCMQTLDTTMLEEGELVDVAGFPVIDNYQPTLSDAILRPAGASVPIVAKRITAGAAFAGTDNSELVQVAGQLIETSLYYGRYDLAFIFRGSYLPGRPPSGFGRYTNKYLWLPRLEGSKVTVTGVFSPKVDALKTRRERGDTVGVASPAAAITGRRGCRGAPSWWTSQHTLTILGAVLLLTLAVLVWVALLRRRVKQQTLLDTPQRGTLPAPGGA